MAVVFISPKKKQKIFLGWLVAGLAVFMALISLWIFYFSSKNEVAPGIVFNKPKVTVNLSILDFEKFKGLEPFGEIEIQFEYTARDSKGKTSRGTISATSMSEARETLESMGIIIVNITEVRLGRENPFTPFYQIPILPPTPAQGQSSGGSQAQGQGQTTGQQNEPQYILTPDGQVVEIGQ